MENHVLRKKHIMNIHRLAWDLQRSDVSRLQKVRIATVPRLGCHMQTFRRLIIMLLLVWIPYWTITVYWYIQGIRYITVYWYIQGDV